jgi:Tfp pilus assembly protein PilP
LKEKLLSENSSFKIPFLLELEGEGNLGQEWCLALVGNGKAENHMPSLVMAFEVKNVQQAAQMAKKLFSSENPALEKRIYKEFEINHIKNGFLTPLEYFFSENFLFIATGENGSNNLIDTIQQERPSLEKNKIYSSSGVSLNSHFLLFFDAAKLSALAKSGIENAPLELLSGFAKTDPKPEEVLYLASVVESLAMDTVFTLEKIKLKSYIALKDLPSIRKKGVPVPDAKTMVVAKAAPPPQKEIPLEQEPSATKKVVEQEPQKPEVVLPDEKEKEKIEATPMGKEIVPPPSAPEASLPQPPQPPLSEEEKISPPPAEETIILPPEKEGEIKTTAKEDESKEPEEGAKEEPKGEKVEPKVEFVYQSTDDTGQQLRDPFASLIDIEVSKVVPTVDISSLWKELSKVEPINLYLYSHAQKDDPKLINAIENLTEYFKDSKKLEKKPEEEVNKKLEEYSSTVARLNSQYKAKIISPLNFDLDSLSLVGIIMGEKQNIALVQASDQKGYTLKTNDIVGTDYGKVMSITRDQVTIEANFRDYIGKISTKSKKLKLMKEEE